MKPLAFLIAMAIYAVPAEASDSYVQSLLNEARALQAAGDYKAAAQAYKLAQRTADIRRSLDHMHEYSAIAFALARTYEEWAEADPSQAPELLQEALHEYRSIIETEPSPRIPATAAAYNNAAQVCVKLNRPGDAQKSFEQAIRSSDRLSSFYLANYATFLTSIGKTDYAIPLFERAIAMKPDDVVTQAKLLQIYPGACVTGELWRLVERDELERAANLAFENIGRPFDSTVKRDLLGIVAVSLAGTHMPAAAFPSSFAAKRLDELREDPAIGQGARQLIRLFEGKDLGQDAFSWWKESPESTRPSIASPEAFSMLARELGSQVRQTEPDRAERYFTLAIDVSDGRDPDAFVQLADHYFARKQLGKLEQFTERYRDQMLFLKGRAYRDANYESVYRYHVALGTLYAYTEWNVPPDDPRSPIYHFEHARDAAREVNAATGAKVILDPRSVELLAASYREIEPSTKKDLELRLDIAEEYVAADRTASAEDVLLPVAEDKRVTEGTDKIRFDRLRAQVPLAKNPNPDRSRYRVPSTAASSIELVPGPERPLEKKLEDRLKDLIEKKLRLPPERQWVIDEQLKDIGVTKVEKHQAGKGVIEMTLEGERVRLAYEPGKKTTTSTAPQQAPRMLVVLDPRANVPPNIKHVLPRLLSDYLSAKPDHRRDVFTKLEGLDVKNVTEPKNGAGTVEININGQVVVVPFVVTYSKK